MNKQVLRIDSTAEGGFARERLSQVFGVHVGRERLDRGSVPG
jgi:hypothetical protein